MNDDTMVTLILRCKTTNKITHVVCKCSDIVDGTVVLDDYHVQETIIG